MPMASQQEAGVGAGADDPTGQEQPGGEDTATVDGGGSWYWTNMLNFSQSGSSSTHTSAGQLAGSQFAAGSPPSSSSVHNNNNTANPNNSIHACNHQVDHTATPLESMLPSHNIATNDPENAVWAQDFLSGPICESKASMHACGGDDGLQELLYPRSVRELLLDVQSPSWDLLHQAAISKSFGFSLGQDDQLHGIVASPELKPAQVAQPGLHLSQQDDRLSCGTASSTLSEAGLAAAEPHWQVTQASGADHVAQAAARSCPMHVPHTTFLQHQFDHARVKQEYTAQLNSSCCATPAPVFAKPGVVNPFLLQHHPQQHGFRIINPAHDPSAMQLNEAAMTNMNTDLKPGKQQLNAWPSTSAAVATSTHLCRTSSSAYELAGGQMHSPAAAAPTVDPFLLNSLKPSGHPFIDSAGFPCVASSNLINEDGSFFQAVEHHQLLQQSGIQAQLQSHVAAGGILSNAPMQYLNQQGVGLKKSRAHLEIGHGNVETGKESKAGVASTEEFNFKRPKIESQQQQATSGSFKNQPARKEKLGERITTLQQLVSPFGRTDTASVLLEAIGYIKFLQEQVKTLSRSYLTSTSTSASQNGDKNPNGDESKPDLRSKGLCLVPLSCTMQVANDNGADYWYGGPFRQ